MQAYIALAAKAVYINQIDNLGSNLLKLINELSKLIVVDKYDWKILAASFKGID